MVWNIQVFSSFKTHWLFWVPVNGMIGMPWTSSKTGWLEFGRIPSCADNLTWHPGDICPPFTQKKQEGPSCVISLYVEYQNSHLRWNLRPFYHDPMWTILPSKDAGHWKVMLQSFLHPMLLHDNSQSNTHSYLEFLLTSGRDNTSLNYPFKAGQFPMNLLCRPLSGMFSWLLMSAVNGSRSPDRKTPSSIQRATELSIFWVGGFALLRDTQGLLGLNHQDFLSRTHWNLENVEMILFQTTWQFERKTLDLNSYAKDKQKFGIANTGSSGSSDTNVTSDSSNFTSGSIATSMHHVRDWNPYKIENS